MVDIPIDPTKMSLDQITGKEGEQIWKDWFETGPERDEDKIVEVGNKKYVKGLRDKTFVVTDADEK